jgi:hypothetical protein
MEKRLVNNEQRFEVGGERLGVAKMVEIVRLMGQQEDGKVAPQSNNLMAAGRRPAAAVERGWKILKEEMVKNLPKREVFNAILIAVAKAYADLNVKEISKPDRDYLVNELTDNILKRFPSIRLCEMPEAIFDGVRGKYGEYYGLSLVAFEGFIERYLQSATRKELVKTLPNDIDTPQPPDLQTQFATAKSNAMKALKLKVNRKGIDNLASSVYYFLNRLKLIPFTNAEKRDILADAQRELIVDLKFKLTLPRTDRNAIKSDIAAYTKSVSEHAPLDARLLTLAKMCARKLALDIFLNSVILEDTDLEALIESRRGVFMEAGR